MLSMAKRLLKDPIGFFIRVFEKKIVGPIKYNKNNDYDAGKYWSDRFSKYGLSMQGAGHDGISKEENEKMYQEAAEIFMEVCKKENLNFKKIKVLEIGPGNGFYTELLRKLGVQDYTAIDITGVLFPKLKSKFPEFKFIKKDVTQGVIEGTYDLILMIDVMQHIVNDSKLDFCFKNIKHCLSKKGVFILSPITEKTEKHLYYIKWRSLEDIANKFHGYKISTPISFRGDSLIIIKPVSY